jgi:hypothetical protein
MEKDERALSNDEILITFLKETKEGKYATIDSGSLNYLRIPEQRDQYFVPEECYYYSTR